MKTTFASLLLLGMMASLPASATTIPLPFNYTPVVGAPELSPGVNVTECKAPCGVYLVGGSATLKYTFLGKEAGFVNTLSSFGAPGGNILNTAAVGSAVTDNASPGLLKFSFSDNNGGSIINGGAFTPFTSMAVYILAGAQSAYLLFNDSAQVDADFDDMIVKVAITGNGTLSTVPLPAALPLLLTAFAGLGGVAGMRRRRALKAA
jgi:hypothetical protein